jgi:protocatechuate 3,4-dioxygenase beta subunit
VAVAVSPTAARETRATEAVTGSAALSAATATTAVTATTALPATLEPTTPPQATAVPEPAFACTPGELTPAQTEGPYYKANPPETASLLQPGMNGTKLTITGYVLDARCEPIPGARVDLWQADSEGRYDNQGYMLRGYQLTDAQGRYSVETVVPGLYPGRTRHVHVKVTAPNGPTLTTQLYFPDESANASDRIYDRQMLLNIERTTMGEEATFNFVINR